MSISQTSRYATAADVRSALAPDGDVSKASAASLTDRQLEDSITEAQAQVDAALRARHHLPLAVIPELVRSITQDIAAYLATLTWRRNNPLPAESPVVARYNRVSRLLDQLAAGKVELDTGPEDTGYGEPVVINVVPDLVGLNGPVYPRPWYGPEG